jgi:hypothetical protein
VWAKELLFCQHTVSPWVIVALVGEKVFEELGVLTFALAPLLPHELATVVGLLPHAVPISATIVLQTTRRLRIRALQG